MTADEGADAVRRILNSGATGQIAVSTADLTALQQRMQHLFTAGKRPGARQSKTLHPRPNLTNAYVAPAGPIEVALAEVWQECLGVDQIGRHDSFFDLGGDSLLALQLVLRIRKRLQCKLETHTFLTAPTLAQMSPLVSPVAEKADTEASEDVPILVTLQTGAPGRRPLFLVHPLGGSIYMYRELVGELDTEQPVYAFGARGMLSGDADDCVEQMAATYVAMLQKQQPSGPYRLGGASFGGLVSFEMAQQLQRAGQQTELLVMLDTPSPGQMSVSLQDDADILSHMTRMYNARKELAAQQLRMLDPDEQLRQFLESFEPGNKIQEWLAGLGAVQLRALLGVLRTHERALAKYSPVPYLGSIVYFRARERRAGIDQPCPESRWIDLATGGVLVHVVPGDHLTLLTRPHVQELASRLKAHLVSDGQRSSALKR